MIMISYDGQPQTRGFWWGNLPHWDVLDRPIFLTMHLKGAIPAAAVREIWHEAAELPATAGSWRGEIVDRHRRIFEMMERWLDRVGPVDFLARPPVATMVAEAIRHREARGDWQVLEWVAMPSHLHVLYLAGSVGMDGLLGDFRRWTGHRAVELLRAELEHVAGSEFDGEGFWQEEWFDHWSRSAEETDRIATYIRRNPEAAGLVRQWQDWPHGSWSSSRA